MRDVLRRTGLRHLLRHPGQALLSVTGIAVGVAVILAVDLAGDSAGRAFELSRKAVTGQATHHLVGGPGGIDEELYTRLRTELGVRRSAPVVEHWVRAKGPGGRTLHLLGIDPLAEAPFRSFLIRSDGEGPDFRRMLSPPPAAVLSASTAEALGLSIGDPLELEIAGRGHRLELVGRLDPDDRLSREALDGLLLVDISVAQDLLGRPGRLSRIDLILPRGGEEPARIEAIRAVLPADVSLVRSSAHSDRAEQMTRAFRLNLRALSLLAVLCGAFLIFNTMTFSVVQRRSVIGTLRALGVTRRQIFTLILEEALLVGLVGSTLGLLLGNLLGRGLVGRVTQTINDLYFVVSVSSVSVSAGTVALSLAAGVGATMLASLAPALEATAAPPRAALSRADLESQHRRSAPRAAAWGTGLVALGALLLALGVRSLEVSFAGLFAVLLGCALMTPLATSLVARLARPVLARWGGLAGSMAARGVVTHLSRTGVAIAALMMAVAVAVGVTLMVDSFRLTVQRWLTFALPADVYVSAAGSPVRSLFDSSDGLAPRLIEEIEALPGVEQINTLRRIELSDGESSARVVALGIDRRSHRAFAFKEGDPATAWPAWHAGSAVLVSEPFAYRRGLSVGDRLTLPGAPQPFEIAGVYYDYASDQGVVIIDRGVYERLWGDSVVSAVSLYLAPGAAIEQVVEAIGALGGDQRLDVRSERSLREESMRVFERTFLITDVLRLLATLVAFIGVLSALMALQLERRREFGVLRALGLTPGRLWGMVTAQTGLMGLVAGLLAVPVGVLMAAMMIFVINRRSFGWTMPLELSFSTFGQAVLLAVAAALLAGIYPALRLARSPAAEALREE